MNIAVINTTDLYGGAARIAWDLFLAYRRDGHRVQFFVGRKRSADPDVTELGSFGDLLWQWSHHRSKQACRVLTRKRLPLLSAAGRLAGQYEKLSGGAIARKPRPGFKTISAKLKFKPDLFHVHNLHGNYFDWTCLPELSKLAPIAVTMHDNWTFTGGCPYYCECDGWRSGCGTCPDSMLPFVPGRPQTAEHLRLKAAAMTNARIHFCAPSAWNVDHIPHSILASKHRTARVINNGRDLSNFTVGSKSDARGELGLNPGAFVLLYTGAHFIRNPWKDWETVHDAVVGMRDRGLERPVELIGLGETPSEEKHGKVTVRTIPYAEDPGYVKKFFQAADVYLHSARADTFPNVILEALACGLPVIGARVGGIPEQVISIDMAATAVGAAADPARPNGIVVEKRPISGITDAIEKLYRDPELLAVLSRNGAAEAVSRFSIERMVQDYYRWFEVILAEE